MEDLLDNTNKILNNIFEWLNIKCKIILPNEISDSGKRELKEKTMNVIEKLVTVL